MSTGIFSEKRAKIPGRTLRTDRWWLPPLLNGLALTSFLVYATVRLFWDKSYFVADFHYIAPFYSPCLSTDCVPGTSPLGTPVGSLPAWLSPAMIILALPGGFRATCYYYRKSYYRAFWLSPPACAVAEPHKKYTGETRFPLIFQNAHRWFFYAAVLIGLVLTYDAVEAFHGKDGGFGVGLGTIILWVNVVLIWAYTLGCHSCRSITGGRLNHFSKHPIRYWIWQQVSKLNARHGLFAFASMYSIVIADAYVWLVASGTIDDLRIFN
ncbi:MAG: hypothetical protein QOH13_2142 [Thermoleophilaceae bacterium]|jgi:hypothetical protein|nr:hypothetical protein [Actinomycetota bacterium]MEA2356742.1 hypothetical protein [Solirubrobacteraceae bacterium]MEA2425732.1 hypothetical protein [Thermoleophilaceae bacterium]